jgi:hypothetical protein
VPPRTGVNENKKYNRTLNPRERLQKEISASNIKAVEAIAEGNEAPAKSNPR